MLKPCPFCGKSPEILYCEEDCCGAKPRSVYCKCGCELYGKWNCDEEATNAWNTRNINVIEYLNKEKEAQIQHYNSSIAKRQKSYKAHPSHLEYIQAEKTGIEIAFDIMIEKLQNV